MRILRAKTSRQSQTWGMTLVEIMVSTALGGIVLAVVASLTVNGTRSIMAMTNYNELDRISRNALDHLTKDVRQAVEIKYFATNYVGFSTLNSNIVIYLYNPTSRTFLRYVNFGQPTTLLTNCDNLTFHMSQRNPSNNFTFYPTTDLSLAKLIDVDWKCSREIKGQKVNTESIQTAKIVMRN